MVYSSPNGTFEDVYELLLKVDLFDDVAVCRGDSDAHVFRGFFPRSRWRTSSKAHATGENSGTFAEFALAPRAPPARLQGRLIDAVVPLAIGLGLSKYYQLVDRGDTTPTNHVLATRPAGLLFDIVPRFVPARLGRYNVLPSLTVPVADCSQGRTAARRSSRVLAKIDSMLRF